MIKKEVLEQMYINSKMSMYEISKQLDISVSTVNWWMSKYKIIKRPRSDANYAKYNKNGDPFNIINLSTMEEAILYGL